ncbi:ANTAR domain-containing protein [Kineococcus sp. SYSU DK004]|uniref:ANTAR domain-containing protein n=1 Tax=Kineococcus sp. SYSU DK004 TaxID=3383125 RepID=UPI003D7EC9A6
MAEPSSTPAQPGTAGEVLDPQRAFAELGALVVGETPLSQVLARVAELTRACVPGADEVSVTLVEDGNARTTAFTGRLAATLDERQYDGGFGPCLDAAQNGQTVRVDDTSGDETYPDFAAVAARQGVRSTVSVGMPMPQRTVGGINVYRFGDPPLDEDALHLLQTFAGYAAVAVANHSLYASAVSLSVNLQAAMQSRAVIEQAKGVLVASLRCTPEEAFQHLVRQSQHANRKLRDLATEVVARAAEG